MPSVAVVALVGAAIGVSVLPNVVCGQIIDRRATEASWLNIGPAAKKIQSTRGHYMSQADELQLTDDVLESLEAMGKTRVSLFRFDNDASRSLISRKASGSCKVFPGDPNWPSKSDWQLFNLLTDGALLKTVPIGAVCYKGEYYDAAECAQILANWTVSDTHQSHPTSVMQPLYQGATCMPQDAATGNCTIGGFPEYSVNVTNVAQIQLAVNFARNLDIRLVVRNTGHDYLGKSTGAGSLSIWTHHLKDVKFLPNFTSAGASYSGPAFKLGAGVQVRELFAAAEANGVTGVGGECHDVGVTGGYIALGGHSPMSPKAGLGADQVLSIDVVTPDGRLVTADETQNQDLFWAIRGGGGATWGVVTSMTVKVYPKMVFSGATWALTTGSDVGISDATWWSAYEAYFKKFPEYTDKGSYGYHTIFGRGPTGGYTWSMQPWLVPGMNLADFKAMLAPLLAELAAMNVTVTPTYFTYDSFYPAWKNHFPTEAVGNPTIRTANRLFPRANWATPSSINNTLTAIRSVIEAGSALIGYNINAAAPVGSLPNAANPAWRDALFYGIVGAIWDATLGASEADRVNKMITNDWMARLKAVSPGSGGYGNEGDVMDPDFQQDFYGTDNYKRLLAIKRQVDPNDVFWAPTAVGSERLYVAENQSWVTLQTGKLCRR